MRLPLEILAQAIEDVLRYELGLPLIAIDKQEEAESHYEEALEVIYRYPTLVRKLRRNKRKWLKEVEDARC